MVGIDDPRQRYKLTDTILTATLEHLFQNPEIVRFFSEWKKDVSLRPIYAEAQYLANGYKDTIANNGHT